MDEGEVPGRNSWLVLVALTVVVGSQLLRVTVTLEDFWLRQQIGTLGVAPVALAPVLLAFVAVVVARPGRIRLGIGSEAAVMVMARLVEQGSHVSSVDVWASAIGLSAFLWLLPLLAGVALRLFGVGLLFGLGLDTALKGAFQTLDVSWMNGWVPWLVTAVVVAALVLAAASSLGQVFDTQRLQARDTLPLIGLGPLLFVTWQLLASPGWMSTATGWSPEASLAVILVGIVVALWMALRRPTSVVVVSGLVIVAVSVLARWNSPWFGVLAFAGLIALGAIVAAVTSPISTSGVANSTVTALVVGNLALVVLVFVYYTTLATELPLRQPVILGIACVVAALSAFISGARPIRGVRGRWPVVVMSATLVIPAAHS